jgi:hypothetical protein
MSTLLLLLPLLLLLLLPLLYLCTQGRVQVRGWGSRKLHGLSVWCHHRSRSIDQFAQLLGTDAQLLRS